MSMSKLNTETARRFIKFVNDSPSPFHVVDECKKLLRAKDFQELTERNPWEIQPGQKYFLSKNQSTIIAFVVGNKFSPGNGFSIVGAHTDSPCLKVKPISKINRFGYGQVGVECYGGGIWSTWFDRDLTIAGRVIVNKNGKLESKLVHIKRPILRVPHLAIHLQRDIDDNFSPNKETHIVPVLSSQVAEELQRPVKKTEPVDEKLEEAKKCRADDHHSLLIEVLCDQIQCNREEILDFELCLADTQEATLGGVLDEFIFSPRLDNLVNAFSAVEGLINSINDSLDTDPNIRMAVLFDNEEVGSVSAQGAGSTWTELILRRLSAPKATDDDPALFERSISRSFLVSADQAHAKHPNYPEKHEANLQPSLHKGPVLKYNCGQKYATTAVTAGVLRIVAEKAGVPLQEFAVRNDMLCGSTIGPILSAKLGIRTVDVGGPQFCMHSIREMCCVSSISQCSDLYKSFFEEFPEIEASLGDI